MGYAIKIRKWARGIIFLIMVLMTLIVQGCGGKSPAQVTKQPTENDNTSITILDYLGRKVVIQKPVKRIACGYAYTGHVVAMLGRGKDIVAVVGGLQRDKVLTELYPHIKGLPVPFSSSAINIEELLSSKPDIVFLKSDTAQNKSEVAKLDKLKIPYVVIDFYSMEEQINSITTIGKVLGEEEKAQQYVSYYRKTIEESKKIADLIPEKERISVYHSVNEAIRTDIKNSLPADWISVTGAINVSIKDDLKTSGDKSYTTLEQIYLWNPDLIIANEDGVPQYIMSNNQWAALKAVREKKVYQMPVGISRWGHPGSLETPLAIMWTAKLVYPEYFKQIDMNAETKTYYKTYFNIDLSDKEVSDILNGKGMRSEKE